ncbi:ribosome hibernation-promoting factor, HPF/YfiA family [Thiohalorhabdus methylotrophus]|uniref:Ribosome hibernation promoting factor n=1 Tax=Thiohalorhabdus methylotrophus TaxID=3242694 RepID=A0ABV4TRI1_9GAMM
MQLDVSGQNIEITDSLHEYVREKVDRVKRHMDHVTVAHVVLSVEKFRNSAEITLTASGATLHADAEDKDMYAAIDAMADKIDRQARRYQGKVKDHHQREARDAKEQPPEPTE